jgi:uncharacterized membrane protein
MELRSFGQKPVSFITEISLFLYSIHRPIFVSLVYINHSHIYSSKWKDNVAHMLKAVFTRFKSASASQVPGMRARKFHARYENFDRFNFETGCDFRYSTCIERLRASPALDLRE